MSIPRYGHIGIIGGVGPFATCELLRRITELTKARKDQDHADVSVLSYPSMIPDRSDYLLGKTKLNPIKPIKFIFKKLVDLGAEIIGVPCNTLHATEYWQELEELANFHNVQLINMVAECTAKVATRTPMSSTVCALTTSGAAKATVYSQRLKSLGLQVMELNEVDQACLQSAVFDESFGLKACGWKSPRAVELINNIILSTRKSGASVIILGCSELSLIASEINSQGCVIYDPMDILAKELYERSVDLRL
jgi:aspartate racemase